jgi:hypothetical protein
MNETIFYPFGPKILISNCPSNIIEKLNNFIDKDLNENDKKYFSSFCDYIPNLLNRDLENIFLSEKKCEDIGLKNFLEEIANIYIQDDDNKFEKLKLSIIEKTNDNFKNKNIIYSDCWINRYFLGDYTPIHTHSGVLSGVIFLKFPPKEKKYYLRETSSHGDLSFFYGSEQNFCNDTWIPEKKVGTVLIFPSWLKHTVYSNKNKSERRSLSFNLVLEENYNKRKNTYF